MRKETLAVFHCLHAIALVSLRLREPSLLSLLLIMLSHPGQDQPRMGKLKRRGRMLCCTCSSRCCLSDCQSMTVFQLVGPAGFSANSVNVGSVVSLLWGTSPGMKMLFMHLACSGIGFADKRICRCISRHFSVRIVDFMIFARRTVSGM